MTEHTPELRVQFTRRADRSAVLRCARSDGSVTWQRHDGRSAVFFPFHDLTHFAVETTLGFRQGLDSLITDGVLTAVRRRIDALYGEWAALAPDSALEVTFDRATSFATSGSADSGYDTGVEP